LVEAGTAVPVAAGAESQAARVIASVRKVRKGRILKRLLIVECAAC
jgi:hypothetical protein